jgi:hypothetical protein
MTTEPKRRTFISYSRVNKEFAIKLAQELKSDNFPIWLDQFDIPTGARWDNELEKALHDCEIFLIILTPASIASENVKDEIGYAIDHGKSILPVLLEACEIPLRLRRFQYVDFTQKSFSNGVESAKQLLETYINQPALSQAGSPVAFVQKTSPSVASQKNLSSKMLIGGAIALVAVIVLIVAAASLFSKKPLRSAAGTPTTKVLSENSMPTSTASMNKPADETPSNIPPTASAVPTVTTTVKPLTQAEIDALPLASAGTVILSASEAAQLNASTPVKSFEEFAEEKYTADQLKQMGKFKKIYLEFTKSQPILHRAFWDAATESELKDNLRSIEHIFELDGKKIPNSSISTYEFINPDYDWPSQGVYVIIDNWTSGKHILKHTLNIKKAINNGESDFAPGVYESEEFIIVFP